MGRNTTKVLLGFFAGMGVNVFIYPLGPILMAIVQFVFFAVFYSICDKIIDAIQQKVEKNKLTRQGGSLQQELP